MSDSDLIRVDELGNATFFCPACKSVHLIQFAPHAPPTWEWNGNKERPTITPSVRARWTFGPERAEKCCHFFVTDGKIVYCNDCTHALNGQTVPMQPFAFDFDEDDDEDD